MPSTYRIHLANIRRAAAVLDELKTTAGCVDCGFNLWPEALHFDHIDPQTKTRSLGWMPDRSKLSTKSRLSKYIEHVSKYCEIRCANCHAHRTVTERHWLTRRGDTQPTPRCDPTLF